MLILDLFVDRFILRWENATLFYTAKLGLNVEQWPSLKVCLEFWQCSPNNVCMYNQKCMTYFEGIGEFSHVPGSLF